MHVPCARNPMCSSSLLFLFLSFYLLFFYDVIIFKVLFIWDYTSLFLLMNVNENKSFCVLLQVLMRASSSSIGVWPMANYRHSSLSSYFLPSHYFFLPKPQDLIADQPFPFSQQTASHKTSQPVADHATTKIQLLPHSKTKRHMTKQLPNTMPSINQPFLQNSN